MVDFWSDRFKSVLVEDGETLVNCLAYVELNPERAGIVVRPEAYRWGSLGYHLTNRQQRKFSLPRFRPDRGGKEEQKRAVGALPAVCL